MAKTCQRDSPFTNPYMHLIFDESLSCRFCDRNPKTTDKTRRALAAASPGSSSPFSADSILHVFVLRALRQQDLGDAGQNRLHEPAVAPNIDRDPRHEQIDIRQLRNRLHGEDVLRRAAHICRDHLHGSGTGPAGEIESNVSFTSQKTYSFRGLAQSFRLPAFGETYPADQRYR